jgi:hypothetical protein
MAFDFRRLKAIKDKLFHLGRMVLHWFKLGLLSVVVLASKN